MEASFAVDSASRAVFLPVVRPKMRCIMALMDQKESLLAVACARLVLLVLFHTSRCVPCCRSQALMRCIMAGMDRRTVMHLAVAAHAGFAGDFAPRAVLSSLVGTPTMLGIMAGMARQTASRLFLAVTCSARLVLPVTMHLVLCLPG